MRSHSAFNDSGLSNGAIAYLLDDPALQIANKPTPLFDADGPAADDRSRAAPSETSGGREAAGSLYLSSGNCCRELPENRFTGRVLKVKPCWCRKWYCRDCAPRMG